MKNVVIDGVTYGEPRIRRVLHEVIAKLQENYTEYYEEKVLHRQFPSLYELATSRQHRERRLSWSDSPLRNLAKEEVDENQ